MVSNLDNAWNNYDQALAALYAGGGPAILGAGLAWAPSIPDRAATIVAASPELTAATVPYLAADDQGQRELAELKLLAQAAMDLAVANDLVEMTADREKMATSLETERGLSAAFLRTDLRQILETPIERGVKGAFPDTVSYFAMAAWADDPVKARQALADAAQETADDIVSAAAGVGKSALGGLRSLVLPTPDIVNFLGQAVGTTCETILEHLVPAVSDVIEPAARLVGLSVDKIIALLSEERAKKVQETTAGWLTGWFEGAVVRKAFRALYEPKRIVGQVNQYLDAADPELPADIFKQTTQAMEDLANTFEHKVKVTKRILGVLKFTQRWLVPLPYGPVVVGGVYLGSVGYAVFSGGDHIDWYRLKKLDRIVGVRRLVQEAVGSGD